MTRGYQEGRDRTGDIEAASLGAIAGLKATFGTVNAVLDVGAGMVAGGLKGAGLPIIAGKVAPAVVAGGVTAAALAAGGPTSPGGVTETPRQARANQDSIRDLIDTIRAAGKVPVQINVTGESGGGTLDVFKRNFDASFGDVGTK